MATMHKLKYWRSKPFTWMGRTKSWLTYRWHNLARWQRILCASVAGVLILGAVTPAVMSFIESRRYKLDADTLALIGGVNNNLASKLTYDSDLNGWDFNAADLSSSSDATVASLKEQAGGGGKNDDSLYAASFPANPQKGITFSDSQTQLSFKMTPQFKLGAGREVDGRLIYPGEHGAKLIYTAKNNGMKEDVVVPKFISNDLEFTYKLNLPSMLTAKLQADGSVGIFSADPVLFGNVSTGSGMDAAKLQSARQHAKKDHLLFALPAPVIKQTGDSAAPASAHFELSGSTLKVVAHHMDKAHYPLSLDPSIVVTNTSDFVTGNNEDDITYGTNQITRGGLTGGTIGSWQTTTNLTTGRYLAQTVYYNGYIYEIGGVTECTPGSSACHMNVTGSSAVQRAQVNTDGTLGSWQDTSTMPGGSSGYGVNFLAQVYNSRLYLFGHVSSNTDFTVVYYANINSDGTLGSWNTTTSLPQQNDAMGVSAYNGYMYLVGGGPAGGGGTYYSSVYYAAINADGTLGSWTATNSLPDAVGMQVAVVYNGYLYSLGGASATGGSNHFINAVYYARIHADGTVGTWQTGPSFSGPRYGHVSYAYNGYIYVVGGWGHNDAQYAQINANGSLGSWTATTSHSSSAGQRYVSGVVVSGYLYVMGGLNESTSLSSTMVEYAKIDPSGKIASTAAGTAPASGLTNIGSGHNNGAAVVYNGCIYLVGGYNGSAYTGTVYQATVSTTGTIGTWSVGSNAMATGVSAFGFAVSGGRMYAIGGLNSGGNQSIVQYASFNSSGCGTSTWTTNATSYPNTIANQSATAYNGYIYMIGQSGSGQSNVILSAQIQSDGSVGSWTWQTPTLNVGRSKANLVAYGGYLYVAGGSDGSAALSSVEYAPITGPGTIGAWTMTSSLNTARENAGIAAYNGYLYIFGGDNLSTTGYATTEYVKINSDGSLAGSTWQTGTSLPTSQNSMGTAQAGNNVFLISGRTGLSGTVTRNVNVVTINNGGSGLMSSWTVAGNSLTNGRYHHAAVVNGGYLYALGGGGTATTTNYDDIQYATLGDDGTVGAWTTSPVTLPTARRDLSAEVYHGYLYIFGGKQNSTGYADVYSIKLNSDGTLGSSWNTLNSLPDQRLLMASVVYNNYIYILGGQNSSATNTVYYAQLLDGGGLGSWGTTTAFNTARVSEGAVANNGYMYVLGGGDGSGNGVFNDVQYAPINSNGTLGSWSSTTSLDVSLSDFETVIQNGVLYILGGWAGTAGTKTVEYAPLNANGTIGNWNTTSFMANSRYGGETAVSNGYVYFTGGFGGGIANNDVQYTSLNSIPRIAHYSKLFDLGGAYNVTGITYGGSLTDGTGAISYRTAGADGVFGSPALASSLAGSSGTVVCTAGSARYVYVQASLDDSASAAFPDAVSTPSYLTSLTVSYAQSHPSPDKRLMHGKYFQDEALQPLDTCAG